MRRALLEATPAAATARSELMVEMCVCAPRARLPVKRHRGEPGHTRRTRYKYHTVPVTTNLNHGQDTRATVPVCVPAPLGVFEIPRLHVRSSRTEHTVYRYGPPGFLALQVPVAQLETGDAPARALAALRSENPCSMPICVGLSFRSTKSVVSASRVNSRQSTPDPFSNKTTPECGAFYELTCASRWPRLLEPLQGAARAWARPRSSAGRLPRLQRSRRSARCQSGRMPRCSQTCGV